MQQPKYSLDQIVLVGHIQSTTTYAPCGVCAGKGTVPLAIPGGHTAECPMCRGRGHNYGPSTVIKTKHFAGCLTIHRREVSDCTAEDSFRTAGVRYMGSMVWSDQFPDQDRRWNVFHEESCFATLADLDAWLASTVA